MSSTSPSALSPDTTPAPPRSGLTAARGWVLAIGLVLALRVTLGAWGALSMQLDPHTTIGGAWLDLLIPGSGPEHDLLWTWQRWDALWYQHIAQQGYAAGNGTVAFYPLFPLLSAALRLVTLGNTVAAELLVSSISYALAVWVLYRLVSLECTQQVALRTVLLVSLFPTAFFFLAPYTESLFLALTVTAFWQARRGAFWWAGLTALAAASTRAQGLLLVLPLAYEYWQFFRARGRRLSPSVVAVVLPVVGYLTFAAYARWQVGESRSSFQLLAIWGYRVVWPWQALGDSVGHVVRQHDAVEALNLVAFLGSVALCVVVARRLPLAYLLYVVPSLALLAGREMWLSPLMSVSRYVAVLFPCFIGLALLLNRRTALLIGFLCVSALLQFAYFDYWVHGGFVA